MSPLGFGLVGRAKVWLSSYLPDQAAGKRGVNGGVATGHEVREKPRPYAASIEGVGQLLFISAHNKPASSRATAAATTLRTFFRAPRSRKRRFRRKLRGPRPRDGLR